MGDKRGGGATQGALHIVATPIGNLADLSPRAEAVLREAQVVLAEDTRIAKVLLSSIGARKEVLSLPGFNESDRIRPIIARLRQGESVALISDAGTPLISDPGQQLVRAAIAAGVRIIPIPGASAVLAAVVASGIAGPRWNFEGFLPRSGADRRRAIGALVADDRASVIFEAGNRVSTTLRDLAEAAGDDRPAALCRELTKLHEEVRRGSFAELAAQVESGEIDSRGEFVIVVGETSHVTHGELAVGPYAAALEEVNNRVAGGASRSDAIRSVAAEWQLDRRRLWSLAHDHAAEGA